MRLVSRSLPVLALALAAAPLTAQQAAPRNDNYRFWLGGGGGVALFSTPAQTRGGVPMATGSLLVKAKRTGLMLTFQEAIGSNEQTAYNSGVVGGTQTLQFNDIRSFGFHLVTFPLRTPAQPYFGVGVNLVNVINPTPTNAGALTPLEIDAIREESDELSSFAAFSAVGGINFNIGPVSAFGQYTFSGSAPRGRLLRGPMHNLAAGLRFNLGGARESMTGGGY
jgi:hypothetical protein